MAFDKNHIGQLKNEIILVEKLGNDIGYFVLLHIASAIYKTKTHNKDVSLLKTELTNIIKDLDNENEDYYKLVSETINIEK